MTIRTTRRSTWARLSALLLGTLSLASAVSLRAQLVSHPPPAKVDETNPVHVTSNPQCGYTLSTTAVWAPAEGGRFGVNVVTRPGCDWAAASAVAWVTLAVDRGVGRGTVLMEVHPNASTSSRSGTVEIAGQTVTVQQDGAPPCSMSVSPTYIGLPVEGGRREVSVTVREGCPWTVTSNASWLASSVKSGTGSGTFSLAAEANDEAMRRTAELTVGSGTVWVSQSGKPR